MQLSSVLIANRGEIALRIARTARELGLRVVVVHAEDDAEAGHLALADHVVALAGRGPAAYLDVTAMVEAATSAGVGAVHPGYGFLSERAELSAACRAAGLVFVGPSAATLATFGDKDASRQLALSLDVPVPSSTGALDLTELRQFIDRHPGATIVLKALAGGGGRGIRILRQGDDPGRALDDCRSEAMASFGDDRVSAELFVQGARHVEVQLAADRSGAVVVLGDRDCSLQRRHQKVVEIGPAPWLPDSVRRSLHDHAARIGRAAGLVGLATVEFLVGTDGAAVFLEVNPRLQVEHTVTEMVTGLDLVALQFALAAGSSLAEVELERPPVSRGTAIQARVCCERFDADGGVRPTAGTVQRLDLPSGPGVRVDTAAFVGQRTSTAYDSLFAKVVVHAPTFGSAVAKAVRALAEFGVEGLSTSAPLLGRVLAHDALSSPIDTTTFERLLPEVLHAEQSSSRVTDPLAVLRTAPTRRADRSGPPIPDAYGDRALRAPMAGTVVAVEAAAGEVVTAGGPVVVIEAMKMQHVVGPSRGSRIVDVLVAVGDTVAEGHALAIVDADGETAPDAGGPDTGVDLERIRPDLDEVIARHAMGLDAARPDVVERRHGAGRRTARENLAELLDPGSFVEYAPLVVAAQRRRRPLDELIVRTPADGLVGGVGTVHADRCDRPGVVAVTYDYTVLAGTQGLQNHRKKDRLFELAARLRLPVVLFAEGGGGRPGDTDGMGIAGLDCLAFQMFGSLSGLVPLVGIASGYCFAGNAALLGTCDVVIATRDANIGMGGPAMIEGGGLGVYHPSEIGPIDEQTANGVVDIVVEDDAAAVAAARQYLSYFQGPTADWSSADQRALRSVVPESRVRSYEVRRAIDTMFDTDSVLELRRGFGRGMVTSLARLEGRPLGVIANDPTHLGGAIDAAAADKAARFVQLCDAFDLPIVFLCDTPGFMVGPDAEAEALVRKAARLFVTSGSITVPFMTIVLRKGYGLGAQAMAGGSFRAPLFTVAWPTGEFGGMGLEGAVKLGYRKELEAIDDPVERQAAFDAMVARSYEQGKALSMATAFEIDDVIDPAESRRWIKAMLTTAPPVEVRSGKKRPCVDPW